MNSYCNNCGKNGHAFHQCKSPITSYGIIAFRENPTNQSREYLMIRRKDTLGFVDFMRGKYSIYNKEYILNMIKQMTNNEKTRILTEPFSKLWGDLWGTLDSLSKNDVASILTTQSEIDEQSSLDKKDREQPVNNNRFMNDSVSHIHKQYSPALCLRNRRASFGVSNENTRAQTSDRMGDRSGRILNTPAFDIDAHQLSSQVKNAVERDPYNAEKQTSKNKFESLKTGVYTKNDYYDLEELIGMTELLWDEPEWGFPKGRRNYQEKDYDCAVREFCEETGFSLNVLMPLKNIQPFEEVFTGSNYKSYKHKYYVAYMKYDDTLFPHNLQISEVSESRWMTFEKCNETIRNYNVEKKRVLIAVEKMLSDNYVSRVSFSGR